MVRQSKTASREAGSLESGPVEDDDEETAKTTSQVFEDALYS